MTPKPLTIAVFDSGFGGLTVLRALLPLIPGARYIYLGDTARLPYGSKSRETVARYAVSSGRFLLDQGADLLVVACNTATALAIDDLRTALPIPVLGVIEPGAHAALSASTPHPPATSTLQTSTAQQTPEAAVIPGAARNPRTPPAASQTPCAPISTSRTWSTPAIPHVLVLATAATVQSGAYTHALDALNLRATEKACPLLVPLVEEGWLSDIPNDTAPQTAVTAEVLRIYLAEAQALAPHASTLLLGCTHYPLLESLIRQTLLDLRYPLTVIDSADATARATAALVAQLFPDRTVTGETSTTFYATDSIEKFARLGPRFLGHPLPQVHLIDLGG